MRDMFGYKTKKEICCICKKDIPMEKIVFTRRPHPILITIYLQSSVIRDRGIKGTVCSRECALKFIDKTWEML